jgi:hypothetical protein
MLYRRKNEKGVLLQKRFLALSALSVTFLASLGIAPQVYASDYPAYEVEDGADDVWVEECPAADFTVTIDDTEYSPGEVASGFSLSSTYSVSAGDGVTVGWAYAGVVQGSYGHGPGGRNPIEEESGDQDVDGDTGTWTELNAMFTDLDGPFYSFYPSIFYAQCPGTDRLAYIQTFPGLTFGQAGLAANLDVGVFVDDADTFAGSGLGEEAESSLTFSPLSNFKNAAYSFWAMYFESLFEGNANAVISFDERLNLDVVQGVWAWAAREGEEVDTYTEFASSFYTSASASNFAESSIDDVFVAEEPAPTNPTTESRDAGTPGIFLTVTGRVGYLFESSEVIYGSYAVAPNSAYQLSIQSISNPTMVNRVLASGRVNSGGHLEATTALPFMAAGNYKIILTGTSANGDPLKLTNHVNVDATGKYTSISSERLQPLLP